MFYYLLLIFKEIELFYKFSYFYFFYSKLKFKKMNQLINENKSLDYIRDLTQLLVSNISQTDESINNETLLFLSTLQNEKVNIAEIYDKQNNTCKNYYFLQY